jgi:hypothetical protein
VGQGTGHGGLRARPHLCRRAAGLRRRPLTYAVPLDAAEPVR